jgi:hypothetical protein
MLDLAENKTHDESRQGEALAPFGGDPMNIEGDFILKAMAAR